MQFRLRRRHHRSPRCPTIRDLRKLPAIGVGRIWPCPLPPPVGCALGLLDASPVSATPPSARCSSRWSALHRELYPKADLALLQRAYDVAEDRHSSQRRKSGDPYITHPLAVASILAELGMDTTTLVAALLHDTVEDTGYSLEELTKGFR